MQLLQADTVCFLIGLKMLIGSSYQKYVFRIFIVSKYFSNQAIILISWFQPVLNFSMAETELSERMH